MASTRPPRCRPPCGPCSTGFQLTSVYGSGWQSNYVFGMYYEMLGAAAKVDFSTYEFKNSFQYGTR